jgi:hypothetical protein
MERAGLTRENHGTDRDLHGRRTSDYELTDRTKTRWTLSELQGNDLMILVLSRRHFCPKDHQQPTSSGVRQTPALDPSY